MSILIRKKQARAHTAQQSREHSARHPRPPLGALALPDDVTSDSVRVIALGSGHVLVENHSGVADVRSDSIRLTTKSGILGLYGQSLELRDVRPGALSVYGRIEKIELPHADAQGDAHD